MADLIGGSRSDFIKVLCFNKRSSSVGVPKDCREFVLSHMDELLSNDSLDSAEKNMVRALVLGVYVAKKDWNKSYELVDKIEYDKRFLELCGFFCFYRINRQSVVECSQECKSCGRLGGTRMVDRSGAVL